MVYIMFLVGVLVGSVITLILLHINTGSGYFTIKKLSDEDEIYTVNVRLISDQKLNKKSRIVLKREYIDTNS